MEQAIALLPLAAPPALPETSPTLTPELYDGLADAIMAKLGLATADLTKIPSSDLLKVDTRNQARLAYVASLIRLVNFLRQPANDFAGQQAQANLAMAYIRHVEGNKLAVLNLGERAGDERLRKDVAEMRQNIAKLADAKADLLKRKNAKKEIITPTRSDPANQTGA